MITREEYIMRKNEIEESISQSRRDQHRELVALNDKFEMRLQDERNEYRRRIQVIYDERAAARLEIDNKHKRLRRELWEQDSLLVAEWRNNLTEGGES